MWTSSMSLVGRCFVIFGVTITLVDSIVAAPIEAPVTFITLQPTSHELIWPLPANTIHIPFPFELQVARQANSSRSAIGFTHLGYSAVDPDGRSATLTVSLALVNVASPERSSAGGIQASLMRFVGQAVDISLSASVAETNRLRTALRLPAQLGGNDGVWPFQIKWMDVDGRVLYDWLTTANGLAWSVTGQADIVVKITVITSLDEQCISKWWQSKFGDSESGSFYGDAAILSTELLASGCIVTKFSGSPGQALGTPQSFAALVREIQRRVRTIAGTDALSVTRSDLIDAGKPVSSEITQNMKLPLQLRVYPGQFLLSHPEYVKDLSGNSTGLQALIKKSP